MHAAHPRQPWRPAGRPCPECRRLQRAAAKRAGHEERDDYDDSEDEEWFTDEEEEVCVWLGVCARACGWAGETGALGRPPFRRAKWAASSP